MSLFSREAFEAFVLSLPASSIVVQWGGASVAKVGDKVFCVFGMTKDGEETIGFKVTETSFDILTEIDGIGQAPYFAKRHWVAVAGRAELPESDLRAYLINAHKMMAAKLTRKARAELGLPADPLA